MRAEPGAVGRFFAWFVAEKEATGFPVGRRASIKVTASRHGIFRGGWRVRVGRTDWMNRVLAWVRR